MSANQGSAYREHGGIVGGSAPAPAEIGSSPWAPPSDQGSGEREAALIREAHSKAMEALGADVHPYSASAIRDIEELERELLEARLVGGCARGEHIRTGASNGCGTEVWGTHCARCGTYLGSPAGEDEETR